MRHAIVIFFEEDKYNTMHEALFHDLRDNPNVYFVTEKSYPNSIAYRYLTYTQKNSGKLLLG